MQADIDLKRASVADARQQLQADRKALDDERARWNAEFAAQVKRGEKLRADAADMALEKKQQIDKLVASATEKLEKVYSARTIALRELKALESACAAKRDESAEADATLQKVLQEQQRSKQMFEDNKLKYEQQLRLLRQERHAATRVVQTLEQRLQTICAMGDLQTEIAQLKERHRSLCHSVSVLNSMDPAQIGAFADSMVAKSLELERCKDVIDDLQRQNAELISQLAMNGVPVPAELQGNDTPHGPGRSRAVSAATSCRSMGNWSHSTLRHPTPPHNGNGLGMEGDLRGTSPGSDWERHFHALRDRTTSSDSWLAMLRQRLDGSAGGEADREDLTGVRRHLRSGTMSTESFASLFRGDDSQAGRRSRANSQQDPPTAAGSSSTSPLTPSASSPGRPHGVSPQRPYSMPRPGPRAPLVQGQPRDEPGMISMVGATRGVAWSHPPGSGQALLQPAAPSSERSTISSASRQRERRVELDASLLETAPSSSTSSSSAAAATADDTTIIRRRQGSAPLSGRLVERHGAGFRHSPRHSVSPTSLARSGSRSRAGSGEDSLTLHTAAHRASMQSAATTISAPNSPRASTVRGSPWGDNDTPGNGQSLPGVSTWTDSQAVSTHPSPPRQQAAGAVMHSHGSPIVWHSGGSNLTPGASRSPLDSSSMQSSSSDQYRAGVQSPAGSVSNLSGLSPEDVAGRPPRGPTGDSVSVASVAGGRLHRSVREATGNLLERTIAGCIGHHSRKYAPFRNHPGSRHPGVHTCSAY